MGTVKRENGQEKGRYRKWTTVRFQRNKIKSIRRCQRVGREEISGCVARALWQSAIVGCIKNGADQREYGLANFRRNRYQMKIILGITRGGRI